MSVKADATREPHVHRKNVLGFRTACEQIWGKGAYQQVVAALPAQVREATAGLTPIAEWVPESYIVAWAETVWNGLAARDEAVMRKYVDATIAHGFGRVRRFFLQMMTPESIALRASELWREEHTTGTLDVKVVREGLLRIRLSDHPYVETPLLRMSLAESLRFIVSLTRAENVTESHPVRGKPLLIELRWGAREEGPNGKG